MRFTSCVKEHFRQAGEIDVRQIFSTVSVYDLRLECSHSNTCQPHLRGHIMLRQRGRSGQSEAGVFPGSVSAVCCAALVLSTSLMPAALAGTIPGTGAAIRAARQFAPDKSADPSSPFSYPLLRDVAKSYAKNGFPASFFLSADSGGGPSIDLRTILLYEAGVLKTPVKLFAIPRRKKLDGPTLTASPIPENSGEIPSLVPKVSTVGSLEYDTKSIGPGSTAKPINAPAPTEEKQKAGISADFSRLLPDSAQSKVEEKKAPEAADVTSGIAALAMLPPFSAATQAPPDPQEISFRFWTVPQVIAPPTAGTSESNAAYTGSFVMVSPQGLKSVEGRSFILSGGHILASSNGKPIVVNTSSAKVTVEGQATAYVEALKAGLTRVRVLESGQGQGSVAVKFSSEGKPVELKLTAGEDVIIADHVLSQADRAVQAQPEKQVTAQPGKQVTAQQEKQEPAQSATTSGGSNWNKQAFSPKGFVESNSFFSDHGAEQNPEQRATMAALHKRIK